MQTSESPLPVSPDPRLARRILVIAMIAVVSYPIIIAAGTRLSPPSTGLAWVLRWIVVAWAFYPVPALFLISLHRFRMSLIFSNAIAYSPFCAVLWLYVFCWITDGQSLLWAVAPVAMIFFVFVLWKRERRANSRLLCNKAFFKVEDANKATTPEQEKSWLKEALVLLDEATRICPSNAAAFNEKGYVLFLLGDFRAAERAHVEAIRIDPRKAKYRSNLLGLWVNYVYSSKTQSGARAVAKERLDALEAQIRDFPEYPSLYFIKAELIAMSGGTEEEWEEQITTAKEIYLSGELPLEMRATGRTPQEVVADGQDRCVQAAEWFKNLPPGQLQFQ